MFLRGQLTIFQHWFRQWLGADQATSNYMKQWWYILLTHICLPGPCDLYEKTRWSFLWSKNRLHHWSLGMDKYFHPTHYNRSNYLSMLGLKLIYVSKKTPGGCLNMKMLSYQFWDPHVKDTTVSQLSYLYTRILIPGKTVFILSPGIKWSPSYLVLMGASSLLVLQLARGFQGDYHRDRSALDCYTVTAWWLWDCQQGKRHGWCCWAV